MDSPRPEPADIYGPDEVDNLEDAEDVNLARDALEEPAPSVPWSDVKARLRL